MNLQENTQSRNFPIVKLGRTVTPEDLVGDLDNGKWFETVFASRYVDSKNVNTLVRNLIPNNKYTVKGQLGNSDRILKDLYYIKNGLFSPNLIEKVYSCLSISKREYEKIPQYFLRNFDVFALFPGEPLQKLNATFSDLLKMEKYTNVYLSLTLESLGIGYNRWEFKYIPLSELVAVEYSTEFECIITASTRGGIIEKYRVEFPDVIQEIKEMFKMSENSRRNKSSIEEEF